MQNIERVCAFVTALRGASARPSRAFPIAYSHENLTLSLTPTPRPPLLCAQHRDILRVSSSEHGMRGRHLQATSGQLFLLN